MESFKCNLTCENGYKLNGKRCPVCECYDKPIEKCSFACDNDLAFMPLNDRLCECTKQCNNYDCNNICPYGYQKAPNGCDNCKCNGKIKNRQLF